MAITRSATYRETVSSLCRFIACNRGETPLTDPTDLDTDSFDDLDTAFPATVGLAYADERSLPDVLSYFLQSCGAGGYYSRSTALLTVKRIESAASGTPVLSLTEKDISAGTLEPIELPQAVWKVRMRFRRNLTVLSSDEILASVRGTDRESFVKNEWRNVLASNQTTKDRYVDAAGMLVETAIRNRTDAVPESERLLDLYGLPGQAFRFLARQRGVELDRLDCVYLHYRLFDSYNMPLSRFQTSSTTKFRIFAVEDDAESGGVWQTVWREGV